MRVRDVRRAAGPRADARRRCWHAARREGSRQGANLDVTAHLRPGHTPRATTWTWRSCEEERCYNIVYADSLNAVSAPASRFTSDATHPSLVDTFRATIAKVRALPCDIVIGVHPRLTDLAGKLKRRQEKPARDPFVTPEGCRAYADAASKRLDARVAEENRR